MTRSVETWQMTPRDLIEAMRVELDRASAALIVDDPAAVYDHLTVLNTHSVQLRQHCATVEWERSMSLRPRTSPPKPRSADDLLADL